MTKYTLNDILYPQDREWDKNSKNEENTICRHLVLSKGDSIESIPSVRNSFLFVMRGCVKITIMETTINRVFNGNFIFIPEAVNVNCLVLEDMEALLLTASANFPFFNVFKDINEKSIRIYNRDDFTFKSYKMNLQFLEFCDVCIELYQRHYDMLFFQNFVCNGFRLLLSTFFRQDELELMFAPVYKKDILFKKNVMAAITARMTTEEIIEKSGMSRSAFYNRFNSEFGLPIKKWIMKERAKELTVLLSDTSKPLKTVMTEFGYDTQSELNRFCRRMFDATPTQLRKQLTKKDLSQKEH